MSSNIVTSGTTTSSISSSAFSTSQQLQSHQHHHLGNPGSTSRSMVVGVPPLIPSNNNSQIVPATLVTQFREVHKNTWLKRLAADGKKITVGPKVSFK